MVILMVMARLWSVGAVAAWAAHPERPVKIETITCRVLVAELAAFAATHPGTTRTDAPIYRALIAEAQVRTHTSGNDREIIAAIDDTLVDCAMRPDALVLDMLSHHRIVGDHWRG